MDVAIVDSRLGGGVCKETLHVFQSGFPICIPLRLREMGCDPLTLTGYGGLPQPGCSQDHCPTALSAARRHIGLNIHIRGYVRICTGDCIWVHHLEAEYYCPLHCDAVNIQYLHREVEDSCINSTTALVVASINRFFRSLDNGGGRIKVKEYRVRGERGGTVHDGLSINYISCKGNILVTLWPLIQIGTPPPTLAYATGSLWTVE